MLIITAPKTPAIEGPLHREIPIQNLEAIAPPQRATKQKLEPPRTEIDPALPSPSASEEVVNSSQHDEFVPEEMKHPRRYESSLWKDKHY